MMLSSIRPVSKETFVPPKAGDGTDQECRPLFPGLQPVIVDTARQNSHQDCQDDRIDGGYKVYVMLHDGLLLTS